MAIVLHCPACGRPASPRLGPVPVLDCAACGAVSEIPAAHRPAVDAASEALGRVGEKERQLRGLGKLVLEDAGARFRRLTFSLIGLSLLPTCCVCFGLLVEREGDPDYQLWACSYGPFVAFVVCATVVVWRARAVRARLARVAMAEPPLFEGAPRRCRMCGAALPGDASALRGVLRCGYCHADNLVDASLLARVAEARSAALEHAGLDARAQAERAHAALRDLRIAAAFCAVAALFVGCPVFFAFELLDARERPTADVRYALVEVGERVCIARVREGGAGGGLSLDERPPGASRDMASAEVRADMPGLLRAEDLVGLEVAIWSGDDEKHARIAHVHGAFSTPARNRAVYALEGDAGTHDDLLGGCLLGPPPEGATVVRP